MDTTTAPARALDDAPTNDEALETLHLEGPQDQQTQRDFAAVEKPAPIDPKTRATLTARAALAGVVLHFLDDDHGAVLIVASKWAMTRQMHAVAEVEEFLRRLGGPKS